MPGNKAMLNSKYIKTKQKRKLEVKLFGPFQVLHLVVKKAYTFILQKKWKINNIFYISPLEKDSIRKKRVKKVPELHAGNKSGEYKLEAI